MSLGGSVCSYMCVHPGMLLSSLPLLNCRFLSLQPSKHNTGSVLALCQCLGVEHALTAAMGSSVHSSTVPLTHNSHQQLISFHSVAPSLPGYTHTVSPQAVPDWVVFHPFSLINNWLWLRASLHLQAKEITDVGHTQSQRHIIYELWVLCEGRLSASFFSFHIGLQWATSHLFRVPEIFLSFLLNIYLLPLLIIHY